MVDLLLVNPNSKPTYGSLSTLSAIEPPLWCALLAAYARQKGNTVKILDAEVENLSTEETASRIAEENPLLVAIIAMGHNPPASSTPKMTAVRDILEVLADIVEPSIIRVVGGLHPSALPQKTLEETLTHFVCQGEGFHTIVGLLSILHSAPPCPMGLPMIEKDDLEKVPGLYCKAPLINSSEAPLIDVNQLPMPAWDLLPMEKYYAHNWHCLDHLDQRNPYAVIYTSLGCPFNCTYCPIHAMYGGIRFRNLEKVIEEVDFLVKNYDIRNFKIMDELFALRQEHVEKICDSLIERNYGLNIWAYGRVDTVNENMLRKMKQAGINWVAYGFESANETIRRGVSKKFSQKKMIRAIEMTSAAGINIIANVMFGLPDDSLETMQRTLDMAKEFNFEWFNAYVTMPYPGSQLYKEAVRQGAKLPKKWADWGQYSKGLMPLPTKYLSSKEIVQFRDKAFVEYFSRPEYLNMVAHKFGVKAREHIEDMLKLKIKRKEKIEPAYNM